MNQITKLNLYKNCSTTATTYTFPSQPVTSFTLTSATIGTEFTTGVYKIEIYIKKQDGTIYKESNCKYIDCDGTKCTIYEGFPDNADKVIAYNALLASNECENCSCDKMCILNNLLTETTNDNCCETTSCMCS